MNTARRRISSLVWIDCPSCLQLHRHSNVWSFIIRSPTTVLSCIVVPLSPMKARRSKSRSILSHLSLSIPLCISVTTNSTSKRFLNYSNPTLRLVSSSWMVTVPCLVLWPETHEKFFTRYKLICQRSTVVVVSRPFVSLVFERKSDTTTSERSVGIQGSVF